MLSLAFLDGPESPAPDIGGSESPDGSTLDIVDFYLQSHPHSLNLFWLLVVIQNDKMNLFLIKKENGRRSGWHDGVYFITESTVSAVSAVSAFGDCRRIINKTKLLNVGR